ncbi:MAG: insulinase family protein [Oscillospiraceae bacterium]|nr:insulinase family protein [Oscillospiraceae bacterium]
MKFETIENASLGEKLLFAKHSSGLNVYVFPKKGFSKYYAVYATKYGSIDNCFKAAGDNASTTVPEGIAHFLEHKLFEQPDGSNAFDQFSVTGANANAFTSFDVTAYLFSCTDEFYTNLDLLLDFVGTPYFTDENVAKEQGIIAQEIKMYEDDPHWRVYFNLLRGLYREFPVKYDITGTVESISQITPQILNKCYDVFYTPENMLLFLVGDIDETRAAELVEKHVRARGTEFERIFPNEPSAVAGDVTQKLAVAAPMFQLGFKDTDSAYGANSPLVGEKLLKKKLAAKIALEVFIGKSSELYTKLYEQGLIDDSFGHEVSFEPHYGFSTVGGESRDPKAVRDAIVAAIDEIKQSGFDTADIARVKKMFKGGFLRRFNSIEGIGNSFMRSIFNDIDAFSTLPTYDEITDDEINATFAEHFNPENMVLSVVEPL